MLTVRPIFGVFAPCFRRALVCAAVAPLSLIGCASASALNLTGVWSANYHCETGSCPGTDFPAVDTLTQTKGSEVVTGTNASETITGTLTGNTFVYESTVGGYKAKGTLTVAANGLSFSGASEDSNGTKGTYTATRELANGALSQLGEPSNCIGEVKEEVAKCGASVPYGLSFAYQIQVSPDGKYAYSVGVNGDLIEYERNQANGALTPIGCFSSLPKSEPACAGENAEMEVAAAGRPAAIAISPDGASVYVVSQLNNTIAEFSRNSETGLLSKIGCITSETSLSECGANTSAKGLSVPYGVIVSPDGENVYVTGFGEQAVAEFKRDTGTGALTQLASPNECIGDAGSGCGTTGIGLKEDIGVVASPDGKNVYVAAGATGTEGDVAAFTRGVEGALEQLPGAEACISEKVSGCATGEHIRGVEDLLVSPDGKNVYANSSETSSVIELKRQGSGALEELASPNECVSTETLTGCQEVKGINGAFGVAISPQGEDVYVAGAGENAVAAFERNPTSGVLKQLTGNPCVTEQATGCGDPEFDERVGLKFARRLTVSPDGTNVYVAGQADHAIAELARTVKPSASRVNLSYGPPEGGTDVRIKGSGFAEGARVLFGETPSPEVVVNSASSIVAKSPKSAEGSVAVKVEDGAGESAVETGDHFDYTDKPRVTGVSPGIGSEAGGTVVTITGSELAGATAVRFGSTLASSVTADTAESITATAPPGSGTVDVTVKTTNGTSATGAADKFTYVNGSPQGASGLFLEGYCQGAGYEKVALEREEIGGPGYAYENWACVESDGTEVLIANTGPAPSMANACEVENPGKTTYGYPTEPDSAFSWGCDAVVPPKKGKEGGGGGGGGEPPAKTVSLVSPIVTVPPLVVPPPVLAKTGNVAPVSGAVLVKLPGTKTFVPLSSLRQIPFGSVINATNGTVSVTSALPSGGTQTGQFFQGEFILRQGPNGQVVAELTGGNFSVCPTKRERSHVARVASAHAHVAASGKHVVRKLWANAHGKFSTKGNYAAGAVQGTEWLTEDLCEGTLIRVTRDKVAVTNLVNHRHVEVKTGHKYLAKAP
jgi:DNA-binding beta-propeller fold protein YncE